MEFDFSPALISIKVSVTATVIVFFLGLFAAWKMAVYEGKSKGILDGILTLPLVLPPTVAGFLILLVIGVNGPVGKLLGLLGVNLVFTWQAVVVAAAVVSFPLMYKTARGAFEQIDGNMLRAARTLGLTERKVFWKVTVPLAWPGIAAATALSFARALGEFGATMMVAGSIPGKTQTIPVAIYFATQSGDMRLGMIWVMIIFAISLSVMVASNYWNNRQMVPGRGERGSGGADSD